MAHVIHPVTRVTNSALLKKSMIDSMEHRIAFYIRAVDRILEPQLARECRSQT